MTWGIPALSRLILKGRYDRKYQCFWKWLFQTAIYTLKPTSGPWLYCYKVLTQYGIQHKWSPDSLVSRSVSTSCNYRTDSAELKRVSGLRRAGVLWGVPPACWSQFNLTVGPESKSPYVTESSDDGLGGRGGSRQGRRTAFKNPSDPLAALRGSHQT